MDKCRVVGEPAVNRRPQLFWIVLPALLSVLYIDKGASGALALEAWREEVAAVRRLTESDILRADGEAMRLQRELPLEATEADRARLYNLIARVDLYSARTKEATIHINMAREAATAADDRAGLIEANLSWSLNAVNLGDMNALRSAVNESMELLDGVDRPVLVTEALLRASMAAHRFGQLGDAISMAVHALEVAKQSGDELALAYAEQGMAVALKLNGKYQEARDHYLLMRDHAHAAESRLLEADAQLSIGGIDCSLGGMAAGERMMQTAIEMFRAAGGPFYLAHAMHLYATELFKAGELGEALALYNESLEIYESRQSPIAMWWTLTARSELLKKLGNIEQALADAKRASRLADEIGLLLYRSKSAVLLAALASVQGNLANAYELMQEALELKQQAQMKQSSEHILELAQRSQSEAKQRKIDELTSYNKHQSLIQGWLWTSIGGVAVVLLITLVFLQRLRRSRREIQMLNVGLEQQVQARTAELRKQASYLRTLIDTLPVAVWLKDGELRYLTINATLNRLNGDLDYRMIGKTDAELWQGAIGERLHDADQEVMATRQRLSMEIVIPDNKGIPRWHEIDKAPVLDDDGTLLGTVGVGRDISERKEAERKLKQALEFTEGVINAIPDLLFEMDINGRYLNVWTHTPELLAEQKEMLLGKTVKDALSAESARIAIEALNEAERDGLSFGKVLSIDLPQGEAWFELSVSKKQNSSTSKATFLVLSRDITERIRLETKLLDSRNFLDQLIDSVPDPIFVKDRKHRWVLLNDAFCNFTGQPRDVLLGKSDYDFFPREEADVFWEMDERVFESGEINLNEEHFTSVDGKHYFIQTKKTPFVASGSQYMLVGVIRDITQRKSYEEAREVALDQARRLARSRSEFLSKMSHELRSPLNSILGYAQILGHDRNLGEAYRSKISVIQDSGEHLLMLINDILDFAKSESDRIELYRSDVPTAFFLQTIADIVRAKAEAKGLTFVTEYAAELPEYIHVDEKRLQQVLLNLLSNGVKFTEQGEVRLQVDFTPPQTLHICVRDSGIGIAPDRLESIFQPFEQASEQRYRFGGTGLGLSISRELIRLMGGEIQVESTPGQGSLFRFEIEVRAGSIGDEVFDVNGKICGYMGEPKTLLVVDDLAENRAVVRDMLTPFGFRILEADDGQDGLEKTQEKRPDLILMDINMPDVDGLEVLRRLRKMPGTGKTPVIAMSASVSNEDQAACIAAGADAFLANPLHLQRTLWQIGALLRLEWQYESAEQDSAEEKPQQVPDIEELKALAWLAEIGDMHGIIKHVEKLLEAEPGYAGFCHRLRSLAESYQTKAVLTFIRQYIEDEPE